MKKHTIHIALLALAICGMASCSDQAEGTPESVDAKSTPIRFVVTHPSQSRATDTDFESGDKIGLFIAKSDTPLEVGGNLVNNARLTYDGSSWEATHTLYWDDGTYNAYAYYPYMNVISSTEDQPFSVSTDQSTPKTATGMGGYEASDLLYASQKGLTASNEPIKLTFKHIMSKLKIRLIKGEDYKGDLPTEAKIYIHSTVPTATIDLQAGVATRYNRGKQQSIIAHQDDDYIYSAIIVPQRLAYRQPLIEVVTKGISYLFESKFVFKPGVEHLVNLVITDSPEDASINIGGEIQNWQ